MTWQPKSSQTVENSHWTSSNMDSVPLHSSSQILGPWFPNERQILKRGLWTHSNSPVIFLLSPGKMLLTKLKMFLFQKWLGKHFFWRCPERGDSWCTDLQLQFTPCEALLKCVNRLLLDCNLKLACHLCCIVHISYPISVLQVNFALICFDTALLEQPPLSVITLCDYSLFGGVSMIIVLDHCQVSSVPHYCGFKEQEIPRMYTVWMVIYWNSNVNILIF